MGYFVATKWIYNNESFKLQPLQSDSIEIGVLKISYEKLETKEILSGFHRNGCNNFNGIHIDWLILKLICLIAFIYEAFEQNKCDFSTFDIYVQQVYRQFLANRTFRAVYSDGIN